MSSGNEEEASGPRSTSIPERTESLLRDLLELEAKLEHALTTLAVFQKDIQARADLGLVDGLEEDRSLLNNSLMGISYRYSKLVIMKAKLGIVGKSWYNPSD